MSIGLLMRSRALKIFTSLLVSVSLLQAIPVLAPKSALPKAAASAGDSAASISSCSSYFTTDSPANQGSSVACDGNSTTTYVSYSGFSNLRITLSNSVAVTGIDFVGGGDDTSYPKRRVKTVDLRGCTDNTFNSCTQLMAGGSINLTLPTATNNGTYPTSRPTFANTTSYQYYLLVTVGDSSATGSYGCGQDSNNNINPCVQYSEVKLYNSSYTINFNYNDATGGNSAETASYSGNPVTLPTPTKTGYSFGGWYVASDFSGSALGSTYSPTSSLTIYAKWIAKTTPTITGFTNLTKNIGDADFTLSPTGSVGGSFTFSSTTTSVATIGSSTGTVTLVGVGTTVITATFTPSDATNYNSTTANLTLTVNASPPGIPTLGTVTVTNTTTVSIPYTAPANNGATITSYTITSSPSLTLTYSGTTSPFTVTSSFAKGESYTFTITATNSAGTSSSSSVSNTVMPNPYKVIYDANGATSGSVPVDNSSYSASTNRTVLGNPGNLARTGTTFAGWCVEKVNPSNLCGLSYQTGDSFIPSPASDFTFYAYWTKNTYTVSFDSQQGSSVSSGSFVYGNSISKPNDPTRTGYVFKGWSTTTSGSVISSWPYASGASTDITLYAIWGNAPSFTSINTATAKVAGGESREISGTVLDYVTSMTVGGTTATITAQTSTSLTFTTPALTAGEKDIVLTYSGGNTTVSNAIKFYAVPTISSISPTSISTSPGNVITITGTNFVDVTTISSSQGNFTNFVVNSTTQITVTLPIMGGGAHTLTVATPGGYAAAPTAIVAMPADPVISTQPSSVVAAVGTNVSFSVSLPATNDGGIYTYQWRLNGTNIANATSATLSLTSISSSNAGSYTVAIVHVQNGRSSGTVVSSAATLTLSQSALTVTSTLGTYGTSLTLTSSGGSGTGAVIFTTNTTGCTITSGVLTTTGALTCSVTSTKAADSSYASVSSSATDVVIGTKAITITAGSPSVTWTGSAVSPTNSFSVTSGSLVGSDAISSVTYTYSTANPTNVGTYTITPSVALFSTGSASNYTITYTTGTLTISATTPSAPQTFTATSNASGQSVLAWTAPSSNGGSAITGYSVTSSPSATAPAGCTNTTNTSCTFTGLTNGTTYTFTIVAKNAIGTGSSATANATPSAVPSAPTNVTGTANEDAKSTVTWTLSAADNGAAIAYYSVWYKVAGGSYTVFGNTADATTTSMVVTGLTNGSSYSFAVTAHNASGDSAQAVTASYYIPKKTLGSSATPTASAQSTTIINVYFSITSVADGMIINLYDSATGGTLLQHPGAYGGSTSWQFTGLTPGTDYWVTVQAAPNTQNGNTTLNGPETSRVKVTTLSTAVAPTITTQPANITRTYGQTSTFSVVASASDGGTLSYQWQKDGVNISGATSSSYTSPTQSITGSYGVFTVIVKNTKNSTNATTTSNGVSATYSSAVTITTPSGNILATQGAPFSYQIAATGGLAPLTYDIIWYSGSGTLPAGLSLNTTTGIISGTPTASGDSAILGFQVTDANYAVGNTNTYATAQTSSWFKISVAAPLAFAASASQTATVGTSYSQSFAATGGNGTLTYSGSGTLPTGLSLTGSTISGTPTANGTFNYTITATDSIGATKSLAITFTVSKGTVPTVTFSGGIATNDGYTVNTAGVAAGYTYTVTVPSGSATLAGNGVITVTGVTPSGTGTSVVVTVTVTKTGYTDGVFTYTGTTKAAPLNPTFGTVSRTADGFKVIVTNYSTSYQWSGSSSAGGTVAFNTTTGEMTVTGVAANTSTTVTVTTTRTGYVDGTGTSSGTSLATASISLALPGNATTATYGTAVTLTATATQAGSVTFKEGANAICTSVAITASPWTATCSWTPLVVANGRSMTAVFQPTDSSNYATTISSAVLVDVSKGSLLIPTVTAAAINGSTSSIRLTITHAANSTGTYWSLWPSSSGGPATATGTAATGTTTVDVTLLSANTTYYLDFYAVGNANYANGSTSSPRVAVTTNTTWTITYDTLTNGGAANTSTTYVNGATALILPNPTARSGYAQLGWFDSATNGNKIGNSGGSYTPTGSITLYFQWSPINYTITYKAGSSGSGSDIVQNFNATATPTFKTLAEVSTLITRTGYHIIYWNTNASGTGGTSYVLGATTYITLADLILYPTWAIDTFSVTTTADANSTITGTSTNNNYGSSKTITFSTSTGYSIATVTVDGVSLTGTELANVKTAGSYTFSNIVANHTFTITTSGNTYTVTYKPGTNSSGSDVVESFVYPGSVIIKDSATTATTFYRTGFTATGWSNTDGGTVYYTLGSAYNSAANAVLYPVWTRVDYVITYNGNGNTNTYSANTSYQDGYTRSFLTGGFLKTGYIYTTWNTRADGTGISFNAGDAMTTAGIASIGTTAITLYAQWVLPVPTVTSFVSSSLGTTSVPYGDTVTVTGTNFTGATSVTIGGVAVTTFTVVSSTSITFTSNKACCTVGKVAVTTSGGTGTSTADLTPLPQLPVITTQPASQTKSVGQSVTFTVVAATPADGGTLSYQWKKNTTTIAGATSASYTFTTAALTDADSFWVIVTNTISTSSSITNSNTAALTMTKGSQSTLNVTSTTGTYGNPLTLTYSGGTTAGAVTFSTATAGCSITSGVLSSTSAQTCVVTATMLGNTNYNDVVSADTNVSFAKRSITLKADNVTIFYAGTVTKSVSVSVGTLANTDAISGATYTFAGTGSTTYTSSTTVPTAVGTYSVTPSAATMSPGSANDYNISYTAGTLTINTASQVITNVSTAPTNAMIGVTTYTISATGGGGTKALVYASTTTSVCSVNSSTGVVTFTTTPGTCTLTINQAADTGYNAATQVTQSFTVVQNNVTTLASLSFQYVTLSPGFSSGTSTYTQNLGFGTTSSPFTLNPTYSGASTKYSFNGAAAFTMGIGGPKTSAALNFVAGTNTLVITVTAADGVTTQNYTFSLYRPSTDATLSALSISGGTIAFSPTTSSYNVTVANSVSSVTVTPTVNESHATVKVSDVTVASGTASGSIALAESTTPYSIGIVVTAEDGQTTKSYSISVLRPFAISNLTSLALNATISPTFSSTTYSYSASVTNATSSVNLTAGWTSNKGETVQYELNGSGTWSGLTSLSMRTINSLVVGTNTILVRGTAGDGTTTTYTITVTRAKAVPTISIALTPVATTAKVGTAVNITATTSVAGSVNFKVGGTSITGCSAVATVTSGTTTANCAWTPDAFNATTVLTAELTPTDTTNYDNATSSNLNINVGKGDQATLTVTSTSSSSTYTGTAYTDSPTLGTSGGSGTGSVTYAVANGSATGCNLISGTLTATASGTCLITATKAADTNYNAVTSANFVYTFNKATLTTPADPTVVQAAYYATQLDVTWVAVANASSYAITWYDSTGTTQVGTYQALSTATTYGIPSLTANTTYKVTVRANGMGNYSNSAASNMVAGTTKVQPTAPAPLTVTYKVGSGNTITASGNTLISVTRGQSVQINASTATTDGGTPYVGRLQWKNGAYVVGYVNSTTFTYAVNSSFNLGTAVGYTSCSPSTYSGTFDCLRPANYINGVTVNGSYIGIGLDVYEALSISGSTQSGTIGSTFSMSGAVNAATTPFLTVSGGKAYSGSQTYLYSATGLPAGLSIDSATGAINGTPTAGSTSAIVATITITDGNGATATANVNFNIPAAQTITFTNPGGKIYGAADFTATATSTSNLTVSIASTTTSVCTVSGTTVHIVSAGTCTLAADQAGNSSYAAATQVTQSFTVSASAQATLSISATTTSANYSGSAFTASPAFSTSGGSGTGAVTYAVSDGTATGCTLSNSSASAILTATSSGTCLIAATKASDTNYASATSSNLTFTFNNLAATVSFTSTAPTNAMVSGSPYSITTSAGASSGSITLSTNDSTKCNLVSSSLTFVGVGTCILTASQAAVTGYAAGTVTQTITVAPNNNPNIGTFFPINFTVSPSFSGNTTSYTSTVASGVSTVAFAVAQSVTPTTIQYKFNTGSYASLASGTNTPNLSLNYGDNTISVLMTAQDGVTTKTYTITVTRPQAASTISIALSAGATTATYNTAVNIIATTSNIAGSVNFKVGGTTITGCGAVNVLSGSATCAWTPAAANSATVLTAVFTPTDTVANTTVTSADLTINVAKATRPNLAQTTTQGTYGYSIVLGNSGTLGTGIVSYATTTTGCRINGGALEVDYVTTCAVTVTQMGDSNYEQATSPAVNVVVHPKAFTITVGNNGATYTGSAVTLGTPTSYTIPNGSIVGNDVVTGVLFEYVGTGSTVYAQSATLPTNVGTYAIVPATIQMNSNQINNYTVTRVNGTLTITARGLTQPSAPTLTATAGVLKSITVNWSAVTNAVAYTLKIYETDGTTLLATINGLSGTSKVITATEFSGILDNHVYKMTLTATGDANNTDSIASAVSSAVTTNNSYAITYNTNNSTGGTAPSAGSWITGATASLVAANTGTLVRSGYTFAGWNTAANGSGTDYAATGSATYSTAADLTLYAKWTANGLTITYKSDYASGPVDVTESKTADVAFNLRANTFTRTGYTFAGWATTSGGAVSKADSASVTVLADTTYFAQWTAVNYTVTYNGNSNTGGSVPTDSANYNIGGSVTVKGNTGNLARTGYSFNGWTDDSGNTGTLYLPGTANTTYTVGSSNITFYAKWSKDTYFIAYDSQGGSSVLSSTYQIGDTVTLAAGPTKTGYTFAGWATTVGGNSVGLTYAPSGIGLVTLYAKWTAVNYRLYYSSNSGNGGTVPSDTNNYNIGGTVTVAGNTSNVSRTGYTWAGWNTAADGSGTTYQGAATFTMGSADVTLYAKWTAINYNITYNANGATSGTAPTDSNSYNIGQTISILGFNQLQRTGYSWAGWTTASDGSGTAMQSGYGLTVGSSNITVYAKWNALTYTVTFSANGASGSPSATSATYTTGGTAITLPTVGTMAKIGNSFSGWSTTSNGTPLTSPYTTSSDVTLVAVWTPINYTITYNANGGSSTPTQAVLPMGQQFSLASGISKPNGPNNEVYAFTGWTDGSSNYQAGATYTVGTANLTFTAQWVRVYEVNYVMNGATSTQPSNQLKNDGDVITLASAPTKPGYTFQGWMDQSGQTFSAGQANYTVGLLHYTLNAQWSAINYTITYDANGGATTPQQAAKTIGTTFYLANAITRTGYTFNGWSDGSQVLAAGTQVLVGTSNLTYAAQWTAEIYVVTYDLNGGTGTAIASASYSYGSAAITLPLVGDRVRTNYTFGGWATTNNGTTVGLTYTPTVSTTLYAVWTLNQYTVTYNGNAANVSNTTAQYTAGGAALTLPTVTRSSFVFKGWYSASTGGDLIGQAGGTYTPTATGSIYAQWIQLSLSGVNASDLSNIGNAVASDSVGSNSTFIFSNSSAGVTIPAGSLPAGTNIKFDLLASNATRSVALPAGSSYILSLVVSWVAPDGSVPSTATDKPIVMVVSGPSIKKGASVYAIAGSSVQFLGVATQDGSVSVNITDDPEVAIVKTKPGAPTNVSATNGLDASTVVTWSAPSSDGGDPIANYTVYDNNGNIVCVTSSLTCAVSGLTNGTSYTFTVKAANAVGFSDASSPSAAITPVSAAPIVTPPTPTPPSNNGGGTTTPVTPAAPVTPAKPPLIISLQEITNIQSTSAHANVVVKWPGKAFTVEICATISGSVVCEQTKKFVVNSEDQMEKLPNGDYLLSADFAGLKSSGRYAITATMTTADQQSASEMRSIKTPSGITLTVPAAVSAPLNSNLTVTVQAENITGYVKTWTAVGLPTGLRISKNSASLVITGVAKSVGTFFVDVTATDSDKGFATTRFVLTVAGAVAPAVIIKSATMQPVTIATSTVAWIASAAGTFEVMYDGKSVCKTSTTSCLIKDLLGPLSKIQVVIRDGAGAVNFSIAAKYVSPVKPIEVGSAKFALNSANLIPAQKKAIEKLAATLQAKGFTQLVVSGYADSTGTKALNAKISTDRAKNTYKYLSTFVSTKPLTVVLSGKASTNPIASNKTAAGRAANRRAVVSIS